MKHWHQSEGQKDQQYLQRIYLRAVDQRERIQKILENRDAHLAMLDDHIVRGGKEPLPILPDKALKVG